MKRVLLILASGKSSRFGGYPKALCDVDGKPVAQRTVDLAAGYYDACYLTLNKELYPRFKTAVKKCAVFAIGTGQGDAHSFLRAARIIRDTCSPETVTLCWGDTLFLDDSVFRKASEMEVADNAVGVAICAIDRDPYAWFDTDGGTITASHFRGERSRVASGIHDQSVFVFNLAKICDQLEIYLRHLKIRDEEDFINKGVSKEMRLLESFPYFYETGLPPMKYVLVEPGTSFSFNTVEELQALKQHLKAL